MNLENAVKWLESEEFAQWRLFNGEDKISEYVKTENNLGDSVEHFTNMASILGAGQYKIKAYKGHGRQATAQVFSFEVPKSTTQMSVPTNNRGENYNYSELLEAAKKLALAEMEEKQFKAEVIKRLDALEKQYETLTKSIADVLDEEEENDAPALERIAELAANIPRITAGLDSMKGMFTGNA